LDALGGTLACGGACGSFNGTDCIWIGPFRFGGGNGVVGNEPVTLSGFGLGFALGYMVWACPDEPAIISIGTISIARAKNLLLDILTVLLVPVAITGDGPPLSAHPDYAIGLNWIQRLVPIRRRRIEAKCLRGANQVAIIAKAV
jgi:hypothetical protein